MITKRKEKIEWCERDEVEVEAKSNAESKGNAKTEFPKWGNGRMRLQLPFCDVSDHNFLFNFTTSSVHICRYNYIFLGLVLEYLGKHQVNISAFFHSALQNRK